MEKVCSFIFETLFYIHDFARSECASSMRQESQDSFHQLEDENNHEQRRSVLGIQSMTKLAENVE